MVYGGKRNGILAIIKSEESGVPSSSYALESPPSFEGEELYS